MQPYCLIFGYEFWERNFSFCYAGNAIRLYNHCNFFLLRLFEWIRFFPYPSLYVQHYPKIVYPLILFILSSCISGKLVKEDAPDNIVIYPPPPDTTRIQFLTRISNSTDIAGKQNWFKKFLLGEDKAMLIGKPYGIAIHKSKIYVCDKTFGGLEIINLGKGTFEYFIPSGKGQLKMPLNCFVDTNGFLYVADAVRLQIVVFDEKGKYVTCFGDTGNFKPTDVFIYDNKIWVANIAGNKIHVYSKDSDNKLLYSFTESEPGKHDYLYSPTNVFVTNDKVYVTDFGDFKIKIFSHNGKFLDSLGNYGQNMGQLARPKGIAVDRESNVYVVDAAFENVQVFNKEGKLLMFFGGPYKGPGDLWLPAKVIIDYDNLSYFRKFVDPGFELKYLILVTSQFGPDKINVYGHVEPAKHGVKETETGKKKKKQTEKAN